MNSCLEKAGSLLINNPEMPVSDIAIRCGFGSTAVFCRNFEPSWNAVCVWLSSSGYQPADAYPYELYHNNHEEHPEGKFIVDICIPVKPL